MRTISWASLWILLIGLLVPGAGGCALCGKKHAPSLAGTPPSPPSEVLGTPDAPSPLVRGSDAVNHAETVPVISADAMRFPSAPERFPISVETSAPGSVLPSTPPTPVPSTMAPSAMVPTGTNAEVLRAEAEKVATTAALAKQDARIGELNNQIAALRRELTGRDATIESLERTLGEAAKQGPAFIPPDKRKAVPVIAIPGIEAKQVGEEVRVAIPDALLFQSDAAFKLLSSGEDILRSVVGEIRVNYPDSTLTIEGHTDDLSLNPQNPTYLLDISSYKAVMVAQYLAATLKVPVAKLRTAGCGGGKPVTDNADEASRARNRRIEFVVR